MTVSITHTTTATGTDSGDGKISKNAWNEAHTITGLAQADVAGLTTADSPQFTAINLGHASDTTIARVSAGVVSIEGVNVLTTANLSDTAYASSWDGVTTIAPSKNAVYDRLERAAHPGYKSANWYLMSLKSGEIGAGNALSVNFIYYVPFFLERSVTLSDLGARVTTGAASGEIKLAIYAHDTSTGLPTGTPLAETAGITATAGGAVSADITGSNVTLDGGNLYWAAFRSNDSTIVLQSALADAVVDWTRFVGDPSLAVLSSAATNVAPIITSAETYANAWPNAASETITVAGTTQGRSYALFGKAA